MMIQLDVQFNKNIFYVINDEMEYKFITGGSKATQFDGNVFYGNFINT